jgi:hypothetical protein
MTLEQEREKRDEVQREFDAEQAKLGKATKTEVSVDTEKESESKDESKSKK